MLQVLPNRSLSFAFLFCFYFLCSQIFPPFSPLWFMPPYHASQFLQTYEMFNLIFRRKSQIISTFRTILPNIWEEIKKKKTSNPLFEDTVKEGATSVISNGSVNWYNPYGK